MVEKLLTGVSHHASRYETTTAVWHVAEYVNNVPDISFLCLAAANLHYGLFGELLEGVLLLLFPDNSKHCVFGSYYRRYGEFVAGCHPHSDANIYKDFVNMDDDNNRGARDEDGGKKEDDDRGQGDEDGGKDKDND